MKMMWPFSASNFRISWISGRNNVIAPGFRIRKFPWFLTFICRGTFLRFFNHQPAKVCIFQPSFRTRRCVGFWFFSCPRVRFPCRALSIPGFTTQSDGSRMRYLSRQWKSGSSPRGFDFATILSSSFCSCILFAIVLVQPVRLKWMMLNKWNRLFHSSRVKLPLVNVSTRWCLVSMYLIIWILGCRLILSNNQSRATLWVLDTCLIVGLLPLIIIFLTASLSSKTDKIDETWSTLFRSRLTCLVGLWFFMWSVVLRDRFPCDSWPLDLLIRFGEVWNTSITKSQRSSAGIPSMRKPASREISSASVELWLAPVFDLRKYIRVHLMLILSLQGLPQNQNLERILTCIVVLCFPRSNIVWIHVVWWMYAIKRAERSRLHEQVCSRIIYQVVQYEPRKDISEQSVSKL